MTETRIPWYVVTREYQTFEGDTIQEFVYLCRDLWGLIGHDLGRGKITTLSGRPADPLKPLDRQVRYTEASDGCVYAFHTWVEYTFEDG